MIWFLFKSFSQWSWAAACTGPMLLLHQNAGCAPSAVAKGGAGLLRGADCILQGSGVWAALQFVNLKSAGCSC